MRSRTRETPSSSYPCLLVAYGGARVLAQTFGELRDAVFAKVAQRAIREAG